MNAMLRKLEIMRHVLGISGIAGLLLLMITTLAVLAVGLPAQRQLQQKGEELAWLSRQPQTNAAMRTPMLDDEQALQKFYQQFPPVADLSKVLEQIHQLATDKHIVLSVGEYKLSNDANNANLARYEIIFPVQASYRNLRDFIDAASQQFPTLGLSEINIKRDSINDQAAQVRLSYVLLMVKR